MQKGLQGLSLVACFVLGTAIAGSLAVEIWPRLHFVSTVRAQGNMKTVIVDPPNLNDPIEIVKVAIAGKAAVRGAPSADDLRQWPGGPDWYKFLRVAYKLPSDENWLRTLSFVLRNRTTEKIAGVDIVLQTPETGWMWGPQFSFGQLPAVAAYTGDGKPIPQTREPIAFNPCEEMTLTLADDQHDLSKLGAQPLPISQVYARLRVYLEDGLAWTAYSYEKPVPEHPGQWVKTGGPYFPPNGLPGPHMKKPPRGQPSFSCSGSSTKGGDLLP